MKKYVVVGGVPFRNYTGTVTFTSLKEIGQFWDKEEADKAAVDAYDECGGLILISEVEMPQIMA